MQHLHTETDRNGNNGMEEKMRNDIHPAGQFFRIFYDCRHDVFGDLLNVFSPSLNNTGQSIDQNNST
jgi:hypothetical protein